MTNLDNLIQELFEQILEDVSPEAPKDATFGQYLFADPGTKIRKDKVKEPNTEQENKFLLALKDLYEENYKSGLEEMIRKHLSKMKATGQYKEYINPPNKLLFRGIDVGFETASKIFNLPIEYFDSLKPNKVYEFNKSGIFSPSLDGPYGTNIMSWSTSQTVAKDYAIFDSNRLLDDRVGILFFASPNKGSNDFYLNPKNIIKKFDPSYISPGGFLEREEEVISYGPVEFNKAQYIRGGLAMDEIEL